MTNQPDNFKDMQAEKKRRLRPAAQEALNELKPVLEAQQPDTPDLEEILAVFSQKLWTAEHEKGYKEAKAALDRYYYTQALEAVKEFHTEQGHFLCGSYKSNPCDCGLEEALAIQFNQKGK